MLARITQYLTALIFLSGSAVIYQNVVTPFMRPPKVDVIAMADAPVMRSDHSLGDLFPEGSWQRGRCKTLQTSDGMLLFENWKQIGDDQWKLWPISVVIGRGMSGEQNGSPIIIDAAEGAEIKFTESLDVMSGGAPPIRRGRIIGNVIIYRDAGNDQRKSLRLRTANVGIDNRKIWTTEAIEMNVGRARLAGRDLTIHLSGPTGSAGATMLDRMELIYLDQLVMPLEAKAKAGMPLSEPGKREAPGVISVHCGGRVEYDFALDQLLLRDSVSLVHQVPGQPADQFDCQTLEMILNDPANDMIDRNAPLDWLVEIVATGSPAIAKLPSLDAELTAEEIEFNAVAGLIRANGSRGIRVRRGAITARLASLVYQFDPRNPETIGAIDALGAGIVHVEDPAIPLRKAQWREGFKLRPAGLATARELNTNLEFWVDGDIKASLTDGGQFQADAIAGVLTPEKNAGDDSKSTLVPDRFEITGNVEIDTAAIAAKTQRLLLFFVGEPNPQPRDLEGDDSESPSSLRQWVAQPQGENGIVDPIARPRPTIRGDSISAQLRRNESGLSAKKLSVNGSVEVLHHLKSGDQTLPARLTGEYLQLIDGGGEDVLQLGSGVGTPARFELGDGFFSGPQIQVRTSDNIIWINDAGEFQMPTAALPTSVTGESDGNVKWIKPPHCRWQGEMIFDGRTAVLSDGVDITASLVNGREPWDLHMTGDRLQVDLSEGVQVRDMKAMRKATIQKVSLMKGPDRPVLVQALRRAPDGVLEGKHLIQAAKLTMTPHDGGKMIGQGPGWYRGWMVPKSGESLFGLDEEPDVESDETQLTGIHLIFNDSMQADLTARKLDFLRGIRVGIRSIPDWDKAFDAKTMDSISVGESTLDCDRLRFTIEPGHVPSRRIAGAPTPWEMEATSGVVFRTRSDRGLLEGTASRAAYSSSKDLFTVEGAPNRAAIFRQTLPDGSKGPEGAVRTMSIRPRTMKIENAVLERLNIAAPPGGVAR